MNAVTVAKLKYILPSLRKLNSEALSRELDVLSVQSYYCSLFLVWSRCNGILQGIGEIISFSLWIESRTGYQEKEYPVLRSARIWKGHVFSNHLPSSTCSYLNETLKSSFLCLVPAIT